MATAATAATETNSQAGRTDRPGAVAGSAGTVSGPDVWPRRSRPRRPAPTALPQVGAWRDGNSAATPGGSPDAPPAQLTAPARARAQTAMTVGTIIGRRR